MFKFWKKNVVPIPVNPPVQDIENEISRVRRRNHELHSFLNLFPIYSDGDPKEREEAQKSAKKELQKNYIRLVELQKKKCDLSFFMSV